MKTKTFTSTETFKAYHEAETWLKSQGYSVGRMCSPAPTGFKKGDYDIAKWYNLSLQDQDLMDGTITGDFREGPVVVTFKEEV